ncbi:MAG: hypothetical protein GX299_05435 [Epulopiscium sp.]|nr:hypothetical protein [Candidatus Epulonipiscium sp.]
MTLSDYLIIIAVVVVAIFVVLYFLNKKNMGKMIQAQEFIEQNKTTMQIFVIDKKMEKPTPSNMTKNIYEQLPKSVKMRKMPIVKAKVGPQIVNLMCDKSVYSVIPVKKSIKVELAGIYIVKIHGMNLADKKKKTFSEKVSLKMDGALQNQNKK